MSHTDLHQRLRTALAACVACLIVGACSNDASDEAADTSDRPSADSTTASFDHSKIDAFRTAFANGDVDTMQGRWDAMNDAERQQAVDAAFAYFVEAGMQDPEAHERLEPAVDWLDDASYELESRVYDDEEEYYDLPLLDDDYPERPWRKDDDVVPAFVDAFRNADLDRMQSVWATMNAAQRLDARQQAADYRFSEEADRDDTPDVNDAYDILTRVDPGMLEADAQAQARGETRWQVNNDAPQLPDELGHVRGVVVDATTGEPVSGVTVAASFDQVMLFSLAGEAGRWETQTGDDGSFEIRDIPVGEAGLLVHRVPEYTMITHRFTVVVDQVVDETVELPPIGKVHLDLPTFLTGIVTDSATGEPVAGVHVSPGPGLSGTMSEADGRYMIRRVPDGELSVVARHEYYHDANNTIVAEGPGRNELNIAIDPITTGIVVGTAINSATGEPIVNATIVVAGQTVTTDDQGRFRIIEIESGDVAVQAGGEGYRPAKSEVTLEARGTAEATLELDPITEGAVAGIVVDAVTGEPVPNVEIRIAAFDAITDADGRFEIVDITQGDANVTARKAVFETAMQTIEVIAMRTVDVEIALQPITYGDLVITVTDSSTGAALANSTVRLAANFEGETDADGRIRFEKIPAGDGLLSASGYAYVPGEQHYTLEPATELAQAIALDPVTVGTVDGVILSAADRQPLAEAKVTIGDRTVQTDADGRFQVADISAGDVNVAAGKAVFESASTSTTVIAAEAVSVELLLEPITYGAVSGVIVDALTSEPIADAVVAVKGQNTKTDSTGRFSFERVDAGDVLLTANKRVYEQVEDPFELEPAGSMERRIALPPITWGDIAGQVVDADTGAPLADVAVSLGTTSVRTDAEGRFGPNRVDAGPLNVAARKTSYESGGGNVDVAPDEVTETIVRLEPIRIGTVVGKVVDAKTGETVNGARVRLGRQSLETGADGSFRFEEVSTGSVGVAVRHADYGDGAASGDLDGGATLELLVRVDLRREDVTELEAGLASGGTIDLYGIHFDSGKDQFKASSLSTLNAVLEVMKRAPAQRFTIAGHTDSDGSDPSNQDLSERRARTVIQWLINHGIEARRLDGIGFGESKPTAPNETEAGKALNRRVQLSLAG